MLIPLRVFVLSALSLLGIYDPPIVGISSAGQPGRNGPATYGARDYFGRVSTHLAWIREAMAG
jgi:hypothetical protein